MSVRVTLEQFREQFPELIGRAAESDEAYIIERDGEEFAVLVSAREWRRRTQNGDPPALALAGAPDLERRRQMVGDRLDGLGSEFRLASEKRARIMDLIRRKATLSALERHELEELVGEADELTLKRAEALDRL